MALDVNKSLTRQDSDGILSAYSGNQHCSHLHCAVITQANHINPHRVCWHQRALHH